MNNNKENNGNCQQKKRRFLNIDYDSLRKIEMNEKYKGTLVDLKCFWIYLHTLATTNDYYMIGVYKEIRFSQIKEGFEKSQQKNYDNKQLIRLMNKLCELEVLKIYDKHPRYLMTISSHFADLDEFMDYVKNNEEEFQFHKHGMRRKEFYSTYSSYLVSNVQKPIKTQKTDSLGFMNALNTITPFEDEYYEDDLF